MHLNRGRSKYHGRVRLPPNRLDRKAKAIEQKEAKRAKKYKDRISTEENEGILGRARLLPSRTN